eukprot:TRINITY_DN18184_c0_g1_i1.p1 TRINITY_DN18184_c0_g1~~TRINITY_DN18184_c0_g1_i1.p1  ORF type:complete len:355 (+),score=41.56 TRINITY_DN18184_c0_g1_i1:56-1120(+)
MAYVSALKPPSVVEYYSPRHVHQNQSWDVYRRYGNLASPVVGDGYRTPSGPPSAGRWATPPSTRSPISTPPSVTQSPGYDSPQTPPRFSSPTWAERYADMPRFRREDNSYTGRYGVGSSPLKPRPVTYPQHHSSSHSLIGPQTQEDYGKYSIVLDLDETLVYARQGPVRARPGTQQFLRSLGGRKCEAIIWTAGESGYAQNAVRQIDTTRVVRHSVYRDSRWFGPDKSGTKNLRMLGRDLNRSLLVENTPDCIRDNQENSVLLPDYLGGADTGVMQDLEALVHDLTNSGMTVQDFLRKSPMVQRKQVPCSSGETINAYVLKGHDPTQYSSPRQSQHRYPSPTNMYSRSHYGNRY